MYAMFACFRLSFFLMCQSVFYKATLSCSFIKGGHTVENSAKTKNESKQHL